MKRVYIIKLLHLRALYWPRTVPTHYTQARSQAPSSLPLLLLVESSLHSNRFRGVGEQRRTKERNRNGILTQAKSAHFCEHSNGGGFWGVFGELLPG